MFSYKQNLERLTGFLSPFFAAAPRAALKSGPSPCCPCRCPGPTSGDQSGGGGEDLVLQRSRELSANGSGRPAAGRGAV